MFNETATLILKHADISSSLNSVSATSANGSWENGKQKTTFRLNLKNLLGDLYEKYNTFVLRLNQVSNSSANFPLVNNTDQQVIIQLNGLNFVNSTYNPKTGNNSTNYQMLIINLPKSVAQVNNYSPNISLCNFKKSSPNVELTIELIRCSDGLPAQYGPNDKFPHMVYSFDIYPIS